MTTIYFVRHAEPNYRNHDDLSRELTAKGWADRLQVSSFLSNRGIDLAFSSPYRRSIDTISDFTEKHNLKIEMIADFRERTVGDHWLDDFDSYAHQQWSDFSYKLHNGESLSEVQRRNIAALETLLCTYKDHTLLIGSHGTALSTIINNYDPTFCYADFQRIKSVMPWIVKMDFDGLHFLQWEEFMI